MSGGRTLIEYYEKWIETYKKGAVRDVTYRKYINAAKYLRNNFKDVQIHDLDRTVYQEILNKYAETHEKQTVIDFHHLLKSAILDAMDDGMINKDPTRKVIFKGKEPRKKHRKFMDKYELQRLISDLDLTDEPNYDWLIYLIAKTGLRFSEAIAITPKDILFREMKMRVWKTWNYKEGGGFVGTKNKSSVRIIPIDWQLANLLRIICNGRDTEKPIFIEEGRGIYNSTVNAVLKRHCDNIGIKPITVHGLRHTHASVLLSGGVSVASVSMRLGHSNITTTQKVYLHVIKELEAQDTDVIIREMSSCG